jgi:PBP1b-binding outer membrane lipoprotein LpoB
MLRFICLVLAVSLLLTACGSDETITTTSHSKNPTASIAPERPPTIALPITFTSTVSEPTTTPAVDSTRTGKIKDFFPTFTNSAAISSFSAEATQLWNIAGRFRIDYEKAVYASYTATATKK